MALSINNDVATANCARLAADGLTNVTCMAMDLSSFASIKSAAATITAKHKSIDVLLHIAATIVSPLPPSPRCPAFLIQPLACVHPVCLVPVCCTRSYTCDSAINSSTKPPSLPAHRVRTYVQTDNNKQIHTRAKGMLNVTADGIVGTVQVDAIAPALLTNLLKTQLLAAPKPRVVYVGSANCYDPLDWPDNNRVQAAVEWATGKDPHPIPQNQCVFLSHEYDTCVGGSVCLFAQLR